MVAAEVLEKGAEAQVDPADRREQPILRHLLHRALTQLPVAPVLLVDFSEPCSPIHELPPCSISPN